MRITLSLFALAAAVALAPAPVSAQQTLSMDAAVEEALEANPSLRASVLAARSADRLVLEQEALYQFVLQLDGNVIVGNTAQVAQRPNIVYPYTESVDLGAQLTRAMPWGMTVTARVDGTRIFRRSLFNPTVGVQETGPGYGLGLQLTITQSFLRGFGETVGLAPLYQARADEVFADRARDRTASLLIRDLLVAYWELWYAERVVALETSARDLSQSLLDQAAQRATLGALAPADTFLFETQVASAASRIAIAELAVENARTVLAGLLGRIAGTVPATTPEPPRLAAVALTDVVEVVVESAPEVMEADAQIESARVAARTSGQLLQPLLDASATVAVLGMGYDDIGQTFSTFGSFTAVQFLATLTYQQPLDDTQLHMQQERAMIAIEIAEQNARAARADAAALAMRAIQTDRSATARVALAEHTVDVARRALAAEEERLALGAGLVITVVAATQALRQAELDRARAEVDAQEARVNLLHLVGQLLARYAERAIE